MQYLSLRLLPSAHNIFFDINPKARSQHQIDDLSYRNCNQTTYEQQGTYSALVITMLNLSLYSCDWLIALYYGTDDYL